MSMSTHVVGFRAPDEEWLKMKAVWDACEAADLDVPPYVAQFFNHQKPDPKGVTVELDGEVSTVKEWGDSNGCAGLEVCLAKLPDDLTHLRFFNSL